MTVLAWIFMIAAWSSIITCTVYCFWKLMSSKRLDKEE